LVESILVDDKERMRTEKKALNRTIEVIKHFVLPKEERIRSQWRSKDYGGKGVPPYIGCSTFWSGWFPLHVEVGSVVLLPSYDQDLVEWNLEILIASSLVVDENVEERTLKLILRQLLLLLPSGTVSGSSWCTPYISQIGLMVVVVMVKTKNLE
jgi:hypothetical protein